MNLESIKTKLLGIIALMICGLFLSSVNVSAASIPLIKDNSDQTAYYERSHYDNREGSGWQGFDTHPASADLGGGATQVVLLSHSAYYSFENETSIKFDLGLLLGNDGDSSRTWAASQVRLVDSSGKYVVMANRTQSGRLNGGEWDKYNTVSYNYNPQNAKSTINIGNARLEWWGYTRVEAIFGAVGGSDIKIENIATSKALSGPHSHSYTLTALNRS